MRAPPSESLRASRRATANCGSVNVHTDWISHGSYSRLAQLALPRRVMRLQNDAGRLPAAYFTCCRVQNAPIAGMCLLVSLVASLDVRRCPLPAPDSAEFDFSSRVSTGWQRSLLPVRVCGVPGPVRPCDFASRAIRHRRRPYVRCTGSTANGAAPERAVSSTRGRPSGPRGEPLTIPPAPLKNRVYIRARAPVYRRRKK